jgi:hypothetical protein
VLLRPLGIEPSPPAPHVGVVRPERSRASEHGQGKESEENIRKAAVVSVILVYSMFTVMSALGYIGPNVWTVGE